MKVSSILETIGNTPHVRVAKLFPDHEVWIKSERSNPGGSIKDRIALAMIEAAERDGHLKPGGTIIEPTSGNTGVGLAMVAAVKGYKLVLVMPESMSIERRRLMLAYGATFDLTPREKGMKGAIERALELVDQTPGAWMPQQFENPANIQIHARTTAQEILADFRDSPIDVIITGVGTGGHITGVAEELRKSWPDLKVYAVEPDASPVISGGQPGPHPIQGIGAGFVPANLHTQSIDGAIKVDAAAAKDMARRSAAEEGMLVGISSGATLAAIRQKLADLPNDVRVLGFNYDTGERYLSVPDFLPEADLLTDARPGTGLYAILAGVSLAAVAVPAIIVFEQPRPLPSRVLRARQHVVPAAVIPPVEPTTFVDLPPEDARAFNARVPFVDGPNPAAQPFKLPGGDEDAARATDCLAAAVLFEAGDDAIGERAVAQVVINRVRHPAFPKTICGVVFQGSERSTGCQFTFTCDGALARHPSDAAWRRAREIATSALTGSVYKPVGYATHYHTDWVVPYWQSSLDKIAEVHTHLFFRWTGWWGTPPAFRRQVQSGEPVIVKLAALSDAHKTDAATTPALADAAVAGAIVPPPIMTSTDSFLVTLDRKLTPDSFPALAAKACGERLYCKFLGWTDRAKTPVTLPLDQSQMLAMAFSYLRDRASSFERTLWNCQQFKRADPKQCMKVQILAAPVVEVAPPLNGIHRKGDPVPTPAFAPPPITPTIKRP